MTRQLAERLRALAERQHLLVALGAVWLVATHPWLSMRRVVPLEAGFFDHAHIAVGLAMAVLAVTFAIHALAGGGWRQLFPWLVADFRALVRDLRGLARGRLPRAGGSGLVSTLDGLVLAGFALSAWTGLAWWLSDGGPTALDWWAWHAWLATAFTGLLCLHLLAAALHLVEFMRE